MLLTLPATTADVGEMLSSTLAQEKADNRHCFLKVLSSLRFLAKQGCSIRGHEEKDGNFYQLFSLFCEDDTRVRLQHSLALILITNVGIASVSSLVEEEV